MPGTNAGTGYPLTFRCAKCKVGAWGRREQAMRDGVPALHQGLNYRVVRRVASVKLGLNARHDSNYKYRYECVCGHAGWTRHRDAKRVWDRAEQERAERTASSARRLGLPEVSPARGIFGRDGT